MIPINRPVLGRDLDDIKLQFGLSTADACWLFGMSITKWTQIARKGANDAVTDPTLALLVRFLDQHPELSVIPKLPDGQEMFDLINSVAPTDQKRFSILMGSEASAAYRWRKIGSRQSPTLLRLMYYMKMALLGRPDEDRLSLLDTWSKTVEVEGKARGVEDVFHRGRWSVEAEGSVTPAKRVRAAKAIAPAVKPRKTVAVKKAAAKKAAAKKTAKK